MNDATQKIVAEAAKALRTKIWPNGQEFIDREHAEYIIQSAIEKAHDDGYRQGAIDGVLNERESRAPHVAEHLLGDILAVIHGDGGHYETEHGSKKATEDALTKYHQLLTRLDAAEYALSQRKPAPASEQEWPDVIGSGGNAPSEPAHTSEVSVEQITSERDHYKMLVQELGQELRAAAHASEQDVCKVCGKQLSNLTPDQRAAHASKP